MFTLATCLEASQHGKIDDWVDRYLRAGPWANEGLRDGLRRQRRYWLGPIRFPLNQLKRCCGPEPSSEYYVPSDVWETKIAKLVQGLTDPSVLPPLLVEWRSGILSIRDGNHRAAAMQIAGWTHCWIIIWGNSPIEYENAQNVIVTEST